MKNLQGDVVQIRSIYGTVVVEYTYDAWGNVLSITGMYADTLGVNNPIRYRGYYQDFETGFYYLQSRYYDPAVRRFINADGYINANGDILGFNMYAYCGNSPVINKDSEGTFLFTAIGALVGGVCGAVSALIEGKRGQEVWASAVNGAIAGAATGLATDIIAVTGGTGAVVVAAYAGAGFVGSFVGLLAKSSINGEDMSSQEVYKDALIDASWGGAFGAVGGFMSGGQMSMMKNATLNAGKKLLSRGGVTVGYAIKKAFAKEFHHLGESIAEEGLNNFISWYLPTAVKHFFEK